MNTKLTNILYSLAIGFILSQTSCLVHPPQALQMGSVSSTTKGAIVKIEKRNRLIFLPVSVNGKEYKFLFDTGAPFSISKELQESNNFKVISKGDIIDSDNNRSEVLYVQVDSVVIGGVDFIGQTAFVGDFRKNPVLSCYNIDGIIGSNLMRHMSWLIDTEKEEIRLLNELPTVFMENATEVPFKSDMQFNIELELLLGSLTFSKITLDYGSNGGLDLSKHHFHQLENHHIIESSHEIIGVKQSGLLGEAVIAERKICMSDSLIIGDVQLSDSEIQIGGSDILGNQVLQKMKVGIDWKGQKVYFQKYDREFENFKSFGFYVGTSDSSELLINSVFTETTAFEEGLKAGTKILKVNELNFSEGATFCDYVMLMHEEPEMINLVIVNDKEEETELKLNAEPLKRSVKND